MADYTDNEYRELVTQNPESFRITHRNKNFYVTRLVDTQALVEYLITKEKQKIASLFLEEDNYSFDLHNNTSADIDLFNSVYKRIMEDVNSNLNEIKLSPAELFRHKFAEDDDNQWSDEHNYIRLKTGDYGEYLQYLLDDDGIQIFFGVPLYTVGDLHRRFYSIAGYELERTNDSRPSTGQ